MLQSDYLKYEEHSSSQFPIEKPSAGEKLSLLQHKTLTQVHTAPLATALSLEIMIF